MIDLILCYGKVKSYQTHFTVFINDTFTFQLENFLFQ